ncbi:MAG: restriction endonuclease subunit M [Flavobacterium sp.]|nr:restriction endonuclease subunit M [Flavobacterium sp.]
MSFEIDILENDIREKYPNVLETLLRDHTTQKNIFWATNNYQDLGDDYEYASYILPKLITGEHGNLIMPRIKKDKDHENLFNTEIAHPDGLQTWLVNPDKITFTNGKTWKHYMRDTHLEIACGEAPYITSRYDITTGEFIPIEKRIGLLDRKLRVISENVDISGEWLNAAQDAYKNTYAFEWQGDSLLLAREAMLYTFIENFENKFNRKPKLESIQYIAYIISWNVWQMDGIKGVVPNSCGDRTTKVADLFGEKEIITPCEGCKTDIIYKHNGAYCLIKDWSNKDLETGKKGRKLRFVDLIKK